MNKVLDRADEIYEARALIAHGKRESNLGVAELVRFLTTPGVQLSPAQSQELFKNPKLRSAFKRLKEGVSASQLPMAAAASDGILVERPLAAGRIKLIPSSVSSQVYIRFLFHTAVDSWGDQLILETNQGRLLKLAVPALDSEGEALLLLNLNDEHDAACIGALRDPLTSGTFVRTSSS